MSTKRILSGAVQADADVCNAYDPPKAGAQGTRGLQIVIPGDFATRIASAQDVPGCTYARIDSDGTLDVSAVAQAASVGPSALSSLPVGLRPQLAVLLPKISAATVVGP